MVQFAIQIPDAALASAQAAINPEQYRKALFQTVKRTTDKGARIAQGEIQDVLNISTKYVKRAVTARLETHDPEPPIGYVTISRKSIPLIAYPATGPGMRASKRSDAQRRGAGGIRVQVWKDRAALVFRHGFAASVNFQNAGDESELHRGLFIRTRHLSPAAAAQGLRLVKRGTGAGFAGRLAIQQLLGPPVESAVEIPKVAEAVYEKLGDEAEKQLRSQVDRFTK